MYASIAISGLKAAPARLSTLGFLILFLAGGLAALLQTAAPIYAQQPVFRCTRLTTEDGLSDNMVFCALQDRYGFMWFGTRDGLNRYDGYRFTVYRHDFNDTTSLTDAAITCLYEDSRGNLWIGTHSGGLNKFDRSTETFTHLTHDPRNEYTISRGQISSICEDAEGHLWITTAYPNPSLQRLDPKTNRFKRFHHNPNNPYSISSNLVSSLCKDSNGTIWIGTFHKGINRYDPGTGRFINAHTYPGYGVEYTGNIILLKSAGTGVFWVGDTTSLLRQIHLSNNTFRQTTFSIREFTSKEIENVKAIYRDQDGYLWAGIAEAGLYIIDWAQQTYHYSSSTEAHRYGLGSNRIFDIAPDHTGNIWICTEQGVHFFHRQTRYFTHEFDHYPHSTKRVESQIRSISKDQAGKLWIGTGGQGLYLSTESSYRQFKLSRTNSNTFNTNTINILYTLPSTGELLLGTNAGVYRQTSLQTFTYYPLDITGWRVWSMMEDYKHNLWVGTLHEGLTRIDLLTGKRERYLNSKSTVSMLWGNSHIFALHQDRQRRVWIGTNQGLYRYNETTNSFTHYFHRNNDSTSLSHNHVWFIHEAENGTLWIGTSGGGLNAFNPNTGRFTHFTEKHGLPSNIICGILEDNHGNLWISTNKGLARFTPATAQCRNFGTGDGLYISEFHFKTCFRDTDGSMFFGGTGGFVHFHPDSIAINSRPPLLALTSFKVFDRELRLDTSITLKREVLLNHDDNYFSIEFAALDFANPAANRYRYKLQGYDNQWRQTDGARPYASYTDVPPGAYTLLVQGANSDGVWNERGVTLSIVVAPAWWQTLWFRLGIALLLLLSLSALAAWRYRTLRQRNTMEKKLVESQLQALRSQMNPHFIFNSLNSILHFITSNDAETAHVYLSKFSKLIRATLEHSRSEFIPLAEELRLLGIYLELEALRFDNRFDYQIELDPSIDIYAQHIPPLLIQPYVENAIKHGLVHMQQDGRLTIAIRREGHYIVCSIIDNGIGRRRAQELKKHSVHTHVSRGISLTRDRLEILNSLHSEQYGVQINDLTDHNGDSRGTRVDIRISPTQGAAHNHSQKV